MSDIRFYTPKLIIRNISNKAVRILGIVTIQPSEIFDLFAAVDPNELSEDTILRALKKPWGDLYRESEIKKTIVIEDLDLVGFNYSKPNPGNIAAVNSPVAGQVLSVKSADVFEWITNVSAAAPPLVISAEAISLPKADALNSGYLSKEDYVLFSSGVGIAAPTRIWEYQDFSGPVSNIVSLNSFENGAGLGFNSSYIVDGTATIVLTDNNEVPPSVTTSIPGRWLSSNRVTVSSHVGTSVVLSGTPAAAQNCRVYFLIDLPSGVSHPDDYVEAPQFIRKERAEFIDASYVNIEGDESISGVKTFETGVVTNSFKLPVGASEGLSLVSDLSGLSAWRASPAVSNFKPISPYSGQIWISSVDYEAYIFDANRNKWLSSRTLKYGAARNSTNSQNIYLYTYDGIATSNSPYVIPYDATLIGIIASAGKTCTWTAEVHKNYQLISGAQLAITNASHSFDFNKNVDFSGGDQVSLFMNGSNISVPKIELIFARRA